MKHSVLYYVIVWLLILGGMASLAWTLNAVLTMSDERRALRYACQWEQGQVQGDVCIKDGRVIFTKREVLRRVQTP